MKWPELLTVIRDARALLAVPGAWTRGAMFRDEADQVVPLHRVGNACKWDAMGALYKAADYDEELALRVQYMVERATGDDIDLGDFNDSAESVDDVLRYFDRAITVYDRSLEE